MSRRPERQASEDDDSDESQVLPPYPQSFRPIPKHGTSAGHSKPQQRADSTGPIGRAQTLAHHLRSKQKLLIRIPAGRLARAQGQIDELSRIVYTSRTVIIAGAGISVTAGIQPFRSAAGAHAKFGKELFHSSVYSQEQDGRLERHLRMVTELWEHCQKASPTKFHQFAGDLAREKLLLRMYTQNFDGLERQVDLLGAKTIQMHGDIHTVICSRCYSEYAFRPDMFCDFDNISLCRECPRQAKMLAATSGYNLRHNMAGVLKPKLVLYGASLFKSDEIYDTIVQDLTANPEVVIVAGTSMDNAVQGMRNLFRDFRRRECVIIWVNPADPPGDLADQFDIQVRGDADNFAEALMVWAGSRARDITQWRLEQIYPPSVVFTTRRLWGGIPSQARLEISEADMVRDSEDAVLQFWERLGGRDQAIQTRYREEGYPERRRVPRVISRVLAMETGHPDYDEACEVRWTGYPQSEWVPRHIVQLFGSSKLEEFLQKHHDGGT